VPRTIGSIERGPSTAGEIAEALPGDEFLPHAQYRPTRPITIDAPPETVWPWLVQVGCRRAGFYSNDLLDNLGHPSARSIVPNLQLLEIGQWVPMSPSSTPTDVTAFKVHSFELNRWLLWSKPDSTWVWQLTRTEDGGTRLITRIHAVYDWKHPLSAISAMFLMSSAISRCSDGCSVASRNGPRRSPRNPNHRTRGGEPHDAGSNERGGPPAPAFDVGTSGSETTRPRLRSRASGEGPSAGFRRVGSSPPRRACRSEPWPGTRPRSRPRDEPGP
jgi:hypothetical protein